MNLFVEIEGYYIRLILHCSRDIIVSDLIDECMRLSHSVR